jgi:hypothetical protein
MQYSEILPKNCFFASWFRFFEKETFWALIYCVGVILIFKACGIKYLFLVLCLSISLIFPLLQDFRYNRAEAGAVPVVELILIPKIQEVEAD